MTVHNKLSHRIKTFFMTFAAAILVLCSVSPVFANTSGTNKNTGYKDITPYPSKLVKLFFTIT